MLDLLTSNQRTIFLRFQSRVTRYMTAWNDVLHVSSKTQHLLLFLNKIIV